MSAIAWRGHGRRFGPRGHLDTQTSISTRIRRLHQQRDFCEYHYSVHTVYRQSRIGYDLFNSFTPRPVYQCLSRTPKGLVPKIPFFDWLAVDMAMKALADEDDGWGDFDAKRGNTTAISTNSVPPSSVVPDKVTVPPAVSHTVPSRPSVSVKSQPVVTPSVKHVSSAPVKAVGHTTMNDDGWGDHPPVAPSTVSVQYTASVHVSTVSPIPNPKRDSIPAPVTAIRQNSVDDDGWSDHPPATVPMSSEKATVPLHSGSVSVPVVSTLSNKYSTHAPTTAVRRNSMEDDGWGDYRPVAKTTVPLPTAPSTVSQQPTVLPAPVVDTLTCADAELIRVQKPAKENRRKSLDDDGWQDFTPSQTAAASRPSEVLVASAAAAKTQPILAAAPVVVPKKILSESDDGWGDFASGKKSAPIPPTARLPVPVSLPKNVGQVNNTPATVEVPVKKSIITPSRDVVVPALSAVQRKTSLGSDDGWGDFDSAKKSVPIPPTAKLPVPVPLPKDVGQVNSTPATAATEVAVKKSVIPSSSELVVPDPRPPAVQKKTSLGSDDGWGDFRSRKKTVPVPVQFTVEVPVPLPRDVGQVNSTPATATTEVAVKKSVIPSSSELVVPVPLPRDVGQVNNTPATAISEVSESVIPPSSNLVVPAPSAVQRKMSLGSDDGWGDFDSAKKTVPIPPTARLSVSTSSPDSIVQSEPSTPTVDVAVKTPKPVPSIVQSSIPVTKNTIQVLPSSNVNVTVKEPDLTTPEVSRMGGNLASGKKNACEEELDDDGWPVKKKTVVTQQVSAVNKAVAAHPAPEDAPAVSTVIPKASVVIPVVQNQETELVDVQSKNNDEESIPTIVVQSRSILPSMDSSEDDGWADMPKKEKTVPITVTVPDEVKQSTVSMPTVNSSVVPMPVVPLVHVDVPESPPLQKLEPTVVDQKNPPPVTVRQPVVQSRDDFSDDGWNDMKPVTKKTTVPSPASDANKSEETVGVEEIPTPVSAMSSIPTLSSEPSTVPQDKSFCDTIPSIRPPSRIVHANELLAREEEKAKIFPTPLEHPVSVGVSFSHPLIGNGYGNSYGGGRSTVPNFAPNMGNVSQNGESLDDFDGSLGGDSSVFHHSQHAPPPPRSVVSSGYGNSYGMNRSRSGSIASPNVVRREGRVENTPSVLPTPTVPQPPLNGFGGTVNEGFATSSFRGRGRPFGPSRGYHSYSQPQHSRGGYGFGTQSTHHLMDQRTPQPSSGGFGQQNSACDEQRPPQQHWNRGGFGSSHCGSLGRAPSNCFREDNRQQSSESGGFDGAQSTPSEGVGAPPRHHSGGYGANQYRHSFAGFSRPQSMTSERLGVPQVAQSVAGIECSSVSVPAQHHQPSPPNDSDLGFGGRAFEVTDTAKPKYKSWCAREIFPQWGPQAIRPYVRLHPFGNFHIWKDPRVGYWVDEVVEENDRTSGNGNGGRPHQPRQPIKPRSVRCHNTYASSFGGNPPPSLTRTTANDQEGDYDCGWGLPRVVVPTAPVQRPPTVTREDENRNGNSDSDSCWNTDGGETAEGERVKNERIMKGRQLDAWTEKAREEAKTGLSSPDEEERELRRQGFFDPDKSPPYIESVVKQVEIQNIGTVKRFLSLPGHSLPSTDDCEDLVDFDGRLLLVEDKKNKEGEEEDVDSKLTSSIPQSQQYESESDFKEMLGLPDRWNYGMLLEKTLDNNKNTCTFTVQQRFGSPQIKLLTTAEMMERCAKKQVCQIRWQVYEDELKIFPDTPQIIPCPRLHVGKKITMKLLGVMAYMDETLYKSLTQYSALGYKKDYRFDNTWPIWFDEIGIVHIPFSVIHKINSMSHSGVAQVCRPLRMAIFQVEIEFKGFQKFPKLVMGEAINKEEEEALKPPRWTRRFTDLMMIGKSMVKKNGVKDNEPCLTFSLKSESFPNYQFEIHSMQCQPGINEKYVVVNQMDFLDKNIKKKHLQGIFYPTRGTPPQSGEQCQWEGLGMGSRRWMSETTEDRVYNWHREQDVLTVRKISIEGRKVNETENKFVYLKDTLKEERVQRDSVPLTFMP